MFRKILIPVDFTDKNEAALAAGAQLLEGSAEGGITLLHVIETIEHLEFDEMGEFYRGLETRAAAKLSVMQEKLTASQVSVHHEILFGKRAESIIRYAEDNGMDLLILSSHQVDRDHPALGLGSISYRIAIVARCPVLLVK
jgi:nucleotide-binding universal stress UspA family protein